MHSLLDWTQSRGHGEEEQIDAHRNRTHRSRPADAAAAFKLAGEMRLDEPHRTEMHLSSFPGLLTKLTLSSLASRRPVGSILLRESKQTLQMTGTT